MTVRGERRVGKRIGLYESVMAAKLQRLGARVSEARVQISLTLDAKEGHYTGRMKEAHLVLWYTMVSDSEKPPDQTNKCRVRYIP